MSKSYDFIVFCNLFPPEGGGLERAAEALTKFLANTKNKNVIAVFSGNENKFYNNEGVDCLEFKTFKIFHGFYPFVGIRMLVAAYKLLRSNRETKIIIYGRHFTESILVSILCKLLGRKYIYIDTGFEPEIFKNKFINSVLNILDLTVFRFVVSFASQVIFVSETSNKFVESRYGSWLRDAEVILNGFDETIIEKYPFADKEKSVVFASRLVNVKNPDTVADAYLELANKYPDWTFHLIGKGRCKLDDISKDNLPDNLLYRNHLLSQSEFHKLLSRSAVYINSSISEGLPLSVIEAGGLGCILVLSNIAHNMEVATVTGLEKYSFSPKSTQELILNLEQAMHDSDKNLHKLIQADVLKKFSNKKTFTNYWELLK